MNNLRKLFFLDTEKNFTSLITFFKFQFFLITILYFVPLFYEKHKIMCLPISYYPYRSIKLQSQSFANILEVIYIFPNMKQKSISNKVG